MQSYNKIVIIGATSSIAENCARLWLSKNVKEMILVGRDRRRLDIVAADLQVRGPATDFKILTIDFLDSTKIADLARVCTQDGPPDLVLIAHGVLSDQVACQEDLNLCDYMLNVNGVSPVLFAEAFSGHMLTEGNGTIAIIGSVAGDRGRKSNYVYGAAKGLIEIYVQGLRHRLAKHGLKIVLIKPGPTDTPMTYHLKIRGEKLASVETVAKTITRGIEQSKSIIYAPSKWALIMLVVRNLPNKIFLRMDI